MEICMKTLGGDVRKLFPGLLTQRPRLSWPADPNKLYTVMHFDHGKDPNLKTESL